MPRQIYVALATCRRPCWTRLHGARRSRRIAAFPVGRAAPHRKESVMNRLFVFLLGALLALLLPATALAADSTSTEGLIFKIGGATTVGPAERVDSVIVINGDVL